MKVIISKYFKLLTFDDSSPIFEKISRICVGTNIRLSSWMFRWDRLARAEPTSSALTPIVQSRLFKLMLNIFSLLDSVMLLNNQVIWSEVMMVERSLRPSNLRRA